MKLPKSPPKFNFQEPELIAKLIIAQQTPEAQLYLNQANSEYYYWDDVKRHPSVGDLTSEETWSLLKLSRLGAKTLPLFDEKNQAFRYWIPQALMHILHEVDQGAGGAQIFEEEKYAFINESKEQIIVTSLMDEAIATSQIEGAVTTRAQAQEMLRNNRKPKNKSEQMVLNSYKTIQLLRTLIHQPLSIELLNRIQREITIATLDNDSKAGTFRTPEDKIDVYDSEDNQIMFIPPAAENLPARMQKLIEFANEKHEGSNFIHPLVKAATLHFWLAYEHPYVDGNGRTARSLFYWYMLKSKYWLFEYLTISRIVYESPRQYYRSFLYTEYDGNDLTYSLSYMLNVTKRSIEQLRKTLKDKHIEANLVARTVRSFPGMNARQRSLLQDAIKNPRAIYTITGHQTSHGISYQTARTDLLDLAERKLLDQSSSGKKMIFLPAEDLVSKIGK